MMTSMELITDQNTNQITSHASVENSTRIISFEQPGTSLEQLPLEFLEDIFLSALISSDFKFLSYVCWTFNNMLKAFPLFKVLSSKAESLWRGYSELTADNKIII